MTDQAHIIRETERYERAAKRVQTAIAAISEHPNQSAMQMRASIDMSKSDISALAKLLIEKGLLTREEYLTAIADQAEAEAARYEDELSSRFGVNIRTE